MPALLPGQGRRFGAGITVKVDVGQSADFAIFEAALPPEWAGPPMHVHRAYDEAFYVIGGTVAFTVDGTTHDCPAGSVVDVPRGAAHGFGNPHADPATVLIVTTPGALQLVEGIYELMGGGGALDMAGMAALYARHHSEILTPGAPDR